MISSSKTYGRPDHHWITRGLRFRIQALEQATGSDYFLLRLRHAHFGGQPHKEFMAAIECSGKDVIPYFGVLMTLSRDRSA